MNGNGLNLPAVEIDGLQLAADLVNDRVIVRAGVTHVPLCLVRQLPYGVCPGVVEK